MEKFAGPFCTSPTVLKKVGMSAPPQELIGLVFRNPRFAVTCDRLVRGTVWPSSQDSIMAVLAAQQTFGVPCGMIGTVPGTR